MSLLSNLKTDTSIEEDVDSVGSTGPVESALYPCKVAMAYLTEASTGAIGLVLHLATPNGREVEQTLWVQSGNAKGGNNFYEDKKTGQKRYLPGFSLGNNLSLLTTGKELADLTPEEKVVSVYNYTDKKDVPTKVQMLTELLDQEVLAGIHRQTVNKQVKNDNGVYVDSPDGATRDENEIDKFFCAKDQHNRMTVAEIKGGATEATFADTWEAKWKGVDRDRSRKVSGAAAAGSSAFGAAAAAKPTESLFAAAS